MTKLLSLLIFACSTLVVADDSERLSIRIKLFNKTCHLTQEQRARSGDLINVYVATGNGMMLLVYHDALVEKIGSPDSRTCEVPMTVNVVSSESKSLKECIANKQNLSFIVSSSTDTPSWNKDAQPRSK